MFGNIFAAAHVQVKIFTAKVREFPFPGVQGELEEPLVKGVTPFSPETPFYQVGQGTKGFLFPEKGNIVTQLIRKIILYPLVVPQEIFKKGFITHWQQGADLTGHKSVAVGNLQLIGAYKLIYA